MPLVTTLHTRLVEGAVAGVEGLISDPIEGIERDGLLGGVAGVGSGVLGLFSRPLSGFLGAASAASEGISKSAAGIGAIVDEGRKGISRGGRRGGGDGGGGGGGRVGEREAMRRRYDYDMDITMQGAPTLGMGGADREMQHRVRLQRYV